MTTETMKLNQHIGHKIRHFRRQKDYTITKLGELICKSKSTISKYEAGEISIDIETLYDIASALDISILNLLPLDETLHQEQSKTTDAEKFYLYTYNGLVRDSLRHHLLFVGKTHAQFYADVYDYQNYAQCNFYYYGEVQQTESSIRIFMENPINAFDRCILSFHAPLSQQKIYTGIMSSFSTAQYPSYSIKCLLSKEEIKDAAWLESQLRLSKDELKRIRKKNIFSVIQSEMDE